MNIQRFTAPTSREALAKARLTFGDGTLILSNRATASGIEVVATAENTLAALDRSESFASRSKAQTSLPRKSTSSAPDSRTQVEADATQLAMSTLSFQNYVRERMLRRRHEALSGQATASVEVKSPAPPMSTPMPRLMPRQPEITAQPQPLPMRTAPLTAAAAPAPASPPAAAIPQGIAEELHAMKLMFEDRFNTLTWLGQARQNPIQSNLMLKMIRAGYSPALARTILERLPEGIGAPESVRWVMNVLERNLRTDAATRPVHEEGGVFALVGATGVGKTTTAATSPSSAFISLYAVQPPTPLKKPPDVANGIEG